MAANLWKDIVDFFFPRYCVSCGDRLSVQEKHICVMCLISLPRTNSHYSTETPLEQVFWGRIPIERAVSFFFHMSENAKQIIWAMKYNSQPEVGRYIAQIYTREIKNSGFFDGIDIIIPVPLTLSKQIKRGYNQTHYIAKGISDETGIPVVTDAVRKNRNTVSQTNFDKNNRYYNVCDVFTLTKPEKVRNKHILLVDDVLTTGSTLCSLANTIMAAEGVRFSILTLSLAGQLKGVPFKAAPV